MTTRIIPADEASAYMNSVRDRFQDNSEKFEEFVNVLKDLSAQRINYSTLTERMKDILKGHDDLLVFFTDLLPQRITTCTLKRKRSDVTEFLDKVKARFRGGIQYDILMHVLIYAGKPKSLAEAYPETAYLFRDHPDLLDDFVQFLPDTHVDKLAKKIKKSAKL